MTTKETPASSNDDETTQARTTTDVTTETTDATADSQEATPATEALEWHAPVLVRIDEHTTIPHLLKERVQRSATRPLILRKIGIGDTWRSITAREFYDEVHALAAGLIARGLQPGDRFVSIDGTAVNSTSDITGIIGEHAVGDTIEVQVVRGTQIVTANVTLEESTPQASSTQRTEG